VEGRRKIFRRFALDMFSTHFQIRSGATGPTWYSTDRSAADRCIRFVSAYDWPMHAVANHNARIRCSILRTLRKIFRLIGAAQHITIATAYSGCDAWTICRQTNSWSVKSRTG